VTRQDADRQLRLLAHGLAPDLDGTRRLLERVSQAGDPEMLRAVLTELGAERLLDEEAGR
jgi:hypothetical protein